MKLKIISRYLMAAILCICGLTGVFAQVKPASTLEGKVVDEDGNPLANVLVESFNTQDRTYTGPDGVFSVNVISPEDQLIVSQDGFKRQTLTVTEGQLPDSGPISLQVVKTFGGANEVVLPYQDFSEIRSVSATNVITGEELLSYPTESLIEALSGRLPGLTVTNAFSNGPGRNTFFANVRGENATFYVDGIQRDPTYLSIYEVDRVYVFKDLSSRASLGISAAGPVLWIITKKGESFNRQINVNVEYGVSSPTETPGYVDGYDYMVLRNEANENDGLAPQFSDEALTAYQSGSNSLKYPNVNYYDQYLKKSTSFSRANINFSGGDSKVNFFTMLDYTGNGGLEAVGEEAAYDRYNARANVNLNLTNYISMNVNLAGSIVDTRFPNFNGSSSYYNLYQFLPGIPSNAHPNKYNGQLFTSANYTTNVENELTNGFGDGQTLNTQNNATLNLDLGSLVEGLTFAATGAFDVNNQLVEVKGGTSDLYRVTLNSNGDDSVFRFTQAAVDPSLGNGYDFYRRVTSLYSRFNYNRTFNRHSISSHLSYYQSADETKSFLGSEQPFKIQDISFRTNYAFDNKYIVQVDLAYSGSMKLPDGERFNLYPTIGAGWVISEEAFLSNSSAINYLKLYGSYGQMGYNSAGGYMISNGNIIQSGLGIGGVNEFYLSETLWRQSGSGNTFGTFTDRSAGTNIYTISQQGSDDYELPTRKYLNVGIQTELFNFISLEANYFYENNSGQLSRRTGQVPQVFGTPDFIPVANFGESTQYGVDGMITFTKKKGDLRYALGLNAIYQTGKYITVDEPGALPDYRKRSGTHIDEIRGYLAEGLFQSDTEITNRDVLQSWGAVQPGDVRYTDINNDGVVNEADITATGFHSPRARYGLNISMSYKGFGLFIQGEGQADGHTVLWNPRYFWIEGEISDELYTSSPNYSEVMLDRYPVTNNYPRLTTTSYNNFQQSTFWIADASYLRVKNIELSYTLPQSLSSKLVMTKTRLFVRGRNLFVLSELTDKYGISPERQDAGAGSYPIMKTITAGISCRF